MIRLLIVDDEQITREGLKTFVPWAQYGIEVAGEATDGLDALRAAQDIRPDIILCDVRMPRMNGIDFAFKVKEMLPRCGLVFISGYSDQEYLKAAIRLGAVDYVEKPLDLEDLGRVMQGLAKQIKSEREERLRPYLSVLEAHFGLNPEGLRFELAGGGQTGPLDFLGGSGFRYLLIRFGSQPEDQVANELTSQLAGLGLDAAGRLIGPDELLILTRGATGQALQGVSDCLRGLAGQHWHAGASMSADHVDGLADIRLQAAEALEASGLRRPGGLVFYESLNTLAFTPDDTDSLRAFEQSLEQLDYPAASAQVARLLDQAAAAHRTQGQLIRDILHGMCQALDAFFAGGRLYPDEGTGDWLQRLMEEARQGSAWKAAQELSGFLGSLGETAAGNPGQHPMAKRVTGILRRRCLEDVSLLDIAEEVGLSSNYLCSMYKRETGETILQALHRLRLEKACALLGSSGLKVYEVAYASGFADPSYFSRMFRKYMGMTPNEYRKRQLP